ncbi:MAG: redoxin domain-containing protein [Syntrophales bacterium]|jgi:peroxiredoxin (alkyl hydroperoxide reductase subunit C)|nr:redoxin domain-containing protein [Syntrophales bacterium]MDY0044687.1 redoxin domain-containing protein [Syntrophales bacterium]
MKKWSICFSVAAAMTVASCFVVSSVYGLSAAYESNIYNPKDLKPTDSILKVAKGDPAPDFSLPSVAGGLITLSSLRGKNVVISFVPAAWTPVCSDQWPGYNIVKEIFDERNALLLGITVDNIPTLYAWTKQMGDLWFPVLSDFWPHGKAADSFGVLRSDGMAERAIFVIDSHGIIQYIDVHDINSRPSLESIVNALDAIVQ